MKPEDRLRDATKAYTDPIEPGPDAWARIRERVDVEVRRPRRSAAGLAVAGFASAMVIALVVTLVVIVREDHGGGRNVAAGPGAAGRASQIVAVTDTGELLILGSETGGEVRTLATDAISIGGLAVAPDGSGVYYTRMVTNTECEGAPITDISRVDLGTGAVETVASNVRYPAVSPDGRYLAYTGIPNCSDAGRTILVEDLQTGETREFSSTEWTVDVGIGLLSWAPDSRHLLFTPRDDQGTFPRVLDTATDQTLDEAPRVFNPDGSRINGYFRTDGFVGTRCAGGDQLVPLDVVSFTSGGTIERTLFQVPEECGSDPSVMPDSTGRSVLVLAVGVPRLYTWTIGDAEAKQVAGRAEGIQAAIWMPAGPAPAPEALVAAKPDGRIVVLDAATGDEIRTLADGADAATTLAVTPDGARVFFDRPSTTGGPPREIVIVPTAGGEPRVVLGESGQPALSPDGTKLARVHYARQADGMYRAHFLEILATASVLGSVEGTFDVVERLGYWAVGAPVQEIARPSFAPDSRHLTYTLFGSPEGSFPRTLDTERDITLDEPPIIRINDGSDVAGYLGDSGELLGSACVASSEPDQRDRVVVIDDESGERLRQLFRFPEPCGPASRLVADSSGAHILATTSRSQLYRWSEGHAEPTKVADGIVAAEWLPGT